jgi:serine/threonine protein kinase
MAFSLIRSLVRHTLRCIGDKLTVGIIPIGSIAASVFDEWCDSEAAVPVTEGHRHVPAAPAQLQVRAELESIVQDSRAYRQQIDGLVAEMTPNDEVRQKALTYLHQVPGRIQASLRRGDDPTGLTAPAGLVLRRAEDLAQLLPDKMPRFKPGDRAVLGTDLVVTELLGVGAFGEVWKAVHKSRPHAPPVALKVCTHESSARSLRKEVELLDRVANQGRHKGIVELKYAHLEGDTPCLEYEYVDGGDLATLIIDLHRTGRAKPGSVTKIVYALASAVGFAHRLKPPIVHRDLKPQNILTTRLEGKVHFKIADFGIGGIASDQAMQEWNSETKGGRSVTESAGSCTPLYASPQQRRLGPPDPRDDVYALGVIWFQMLSGDVTKELPRGGSWKRKFHEQGATAEMVALLERCIEDDPAERPADAHVLADELNKILRASSADAPVVEVKPAAAPIPVVPPPLPPTRQPPPLFAAPSLAAPPVSPSPEVPVWKRVVCGIIAPFALLMAIVPLLMLIDVNLGTTAARDSAAPLFAFLCLGSIVFGAWFGAARLANCSWRTIGFSVGACFLVMIVLMPFAVGSRDSRIRPGSDNKDIGKGLPVKE